MENRMKPFSESCEQNKVPILNALKSIFNTAQTVLEIGSGTGQHAVYFAEQLPNITWITSDQLENHDGIKEWLKDAALSNIQGPELLEVNQNEWPVEQVDAVFSANTVHIMGWTSVQQMFARIRHILKPKGIFCLYGPFNYNGEFTSESNAHFDHWLKQRDSVSGIRDFEALQIIANKAGLKLLDDVEMPANNRILVWKNVN